MTANLLVPVAQYLRMSTEHQQYSLENQSLAIGGYAEAQGFEVIQTYSDAARSGLDLKHRVGLRQLLQDVVSGTPAFRAILVYDVSRWGRFQDTDESAHYEFLCKSAGVPVHYCAEMFANDGSLPSLIMKALKRTMAGEYSRELGVKVLAGQIRLTRLGFKQGGRPGYGLRRMLISPAGVPKQILAFGERKNITADRVILVPGPAHEVQTVKEIYRMLISDRRSACAIARILNRKGIARVGDSKWNHFAVQEILTNPKYAGYAVFGRVSKKLYTPTIKLPRSEWIVRPGAFEPIIDEETFAQAQKVFRGHTFKKTDEELLDPLRALLASQGRLSIRIIKKAPDTFAPGTYCRRFGSLRNVYALIGYANPGQFDRTDARIRTTSMREELIVQIAETFPNDVSIIRRGGRWRSRLRLSSGLIVSVLVARSARIWKETIRWQVDPVRGESKHVTLLARQDTRTKNKSFLDFYVVPRIDRVRRFHLSLNDSWLKCGLRLVDLSQFCKVVAKVNAARKGRPQK